MGVKGFVIKVIKKVLPKPAVDCLKGIYRKFFSLQIRSYKIKKFDRVKFKRGINLIAPITHDTGLGQSSRLVAKEIEASGILFGIKNFSVSRNVSSTDRTFEHKLSDTLEYGVNLIHINMHEFEKSIYELGKESFDHHYNIAFWLWEMEEFPTEWIPMIRHLDEIWTPSEFTSNAIRKVTKKKVVTIPYHVTAETDPSVTRKLLGLPEDAFLFLMMFDKNSVSERKNPMGVINAFKKAFKTSDSNVGLVIKINNLDEKEVDKLKDLLDGYQVYFVREMFSKAQVNQFINIMDVYVSLHRAEGFGLVLAEAMLLGVPTISTNYSSTTEFQDRDCSCLVDWQRKKVGADIYPYKKENTWAEPNIDQAAEYMKKLYADREYYERIRINGREKIKTTLNLEKIIRLIKMRMDEINGTEE